MTLNQLTYFCLACQLNSITKAAEQMYISQPAVSTAIRELEKEYGLKLLERQRKGFHLTIQGQEFYEQAELLLREVNRFSRKMHELEERDKSVTLGLTRSIGSLVYADIFPYLMQENADVKVNTRLMSSGEILQALEDHEIDAAIMPEPEDYGKGRVLFHRIKTIEMVYVVSDSHPLAKESFVTVPMIGQEKMVSTVNDTVKTRVLEALFQKYGETPNIWQRYDQLTMVIHMIRAGHAAGFLPKDIVLRNQGIVGLPVQGVDPIWICLAWEREEEGRSVIKKFVDSIRKYYKA